MQDEKGYELLVIGGSAGSLSVVIRMLPLFSRDMKLAVIMVFHRKLTDANVLSDVLKSRTSCPVIEAEDKEEIRPGCIYLAPPEYHLLIEKDRTITLDDSERVNYSRPSIDVTFESAAEIFGGKLACILLSGANADGAEGLKLAKKQKALIVVQDPLSAEVSFMPEQALARVTPDFILNDGSYADIINTIRGQ